MVMNSKNGRRGLAEARPGDGPDAIVHLRAVSGHFERHLSIADGDGGIRSGLTGPHALGGHGRAPSDPINHVYSFSGKYMSQKYFTYPSVHIFKILFRGFNSQESNKNLILRTRPCGTTFITQHSWLHHFRQAEICLVEMICTTLVPASKGHLGGASP